TVGIPGAGADGNMGEVARGAGRDGIVADEIGGVDDVQGTATGGVDDVVAVAQRHGGVVMEEPRLVGQAQPRAAGGDDGGGRPDEVGEIVRGGCVVGGEVVGVEREGELAGAQGPRPTAAEAGLGGAADVVGELHAPDPG